MSKNPVDAVRWWQESVGPAAPVGHVLRRFLADRWVRFHSLPESKRYPDTAVEYAEVVRRHLIVANDLFAAGEEIFIFCSDCLDPELGTVQLQTVPEAVLSNVLAEMPANPGVVSPEDDDFYCVRALVTSWPPAFFEDIVRGVADEKVWGLCFVSSASANVYCPYGGGMDVFAWPNERARIATKFSQWTPSRQDGL